MHILILTASPNEIGLTQSCADAAAKGAQRGEASTAIVNLNKKNIAVCKACGKGWGICWGKHDCIVKDDYQEIHKAVLEADAVVLVSPVYWGEMSESAKKFTDKLRRCEGTKGDETALRGKPFFCVAAAGGSGNGTITCLASMERLIEHVKGAKAGFISITQMTKAVTLPAIEEAVQAMARPAS